MSLVMLNRTKAFASESKMFRQTVDSCGTAGGSSGNGNNLVTGLFVGPTGSIYDSKLGFSQQQLL